MPVGWMGEVLATDAGTASLTYLPARGHKVGHDYLVYIQIAGYLRLFVRRDESSALMAESQPRASWSSRRRTSLIPASTWLGAGTCITRLRCRPSPFRARARSGRAGSCTLSISGFDRVFIVCRRSRVHVPVRTARSAAARVAVAVEELMEAKGYAGRAAEDGSPPLGMRRALRRIACALVRRS